ncbi:Retrovirus-related Pol polyprotein from transposon TNT 1-94 [Euphorbia peplus]|nr:Retrovirus-related Pol polyprotein from transposon TNT 1-94 [Euphorbia peplus]
MHDDFTRQFCKLENAKALWDSLQEKFGGVSLTRLRSLTIKFDTYKKRHDHTMKKHLREMQNMISELSEAGHVLTEEQKVQAVIRSLPNSWEHMKMHLTHIEGVTTFDVVVRHLELEEDRLASIKVNAEAHYVGSNSSGRRPRAQGQKRKRSNGRGKEPVKEQRKAERPKEKKHKNRRKTNVSRVKCFNCQLKGHYANECTAPKVRSNSCVSELYVSSIVLMTEHDPLWVVDSGATDHVTKDGDAFVEFRRIPVGSRWIYVGDNSRVEVLGIGTCELRLREGQTLVLHDVLFAPKIRRNLVSVTSLLRIGFNFLFAHNSLRICLDDQFYGQGYVLNGLTILDIDHRNKSFSYSTTSSSYVNDKDVSLWHARLNHIGQDRMKRLAKEGLLGGIRSVELPPYEPCLKGKMHRKPFGKGTRAELPLQLIHSDVCGPMNVRARHGAYNFITFIDDCTMYGQIYLMAHKSEALGCFRKFMNLVENQLDRKIKVLRTDRGREYLSEEFKTLCDERGIEHQLSIPYTPQQNGVAERRNRTLLDMVRSMMAQASLPISYWGDVLLTATYVLNRVPSKTVTSTPYELWTGRKPDLSVLRPWGCTVFAHDTSSKFGKLGPRGKKCVFIRYPEVSKGYVLVGENAEGRVTEIESRDVVFLENEFPAIGQVDRDQPLFEELDSNRPLHSSGRNTEENATDLDNGLDQDPILNYDREMDHIPQNVSNVTDPNASGSEFLDSNENKELSIRERISGYDEYMRHVYQDREESRQTKRQRVKRRRFGIEGEALLITPSDEAEPKNVSDALSCPEKDKWKKAMEEEMDSMKVNQVWELVDLPEGRKAVKSKWVLKVKRRADNSIERYKARLVAKGFTQQEGIDYEETFSPVVRFTSIRLILAIVASLDLELHQMDVKTAFLNGELNEEIYMEQPVGFVVPGCEQKVCKLNKSIYGLKQSSRQWYIRFHNQMISNDFKILEEDHCVYIKRSGRKFVILSLYVDDILIAGNDIAFVNQIKSWLSSSFEMKDMGEAAYILGVKITRNRSKKLLGSKVP